MMPPKKKGAAAASPVAKKRQTKRAAPKKLRDDLEAAAGGQLLVDATASEEEGGLAGPPGGIDEEDNTGSVAGGVVAAVVVKEEGFGDAQAQLAAEVEHTPVAAATVTSSGHDRDCPADAAAASTNGDINAASVGSEEAASAALKMEVEAEEEPDAVATDAGLPAEKGQEVDAHAHAYTHVAAAAEEEAAGGAAVECGDAGLVTELMAIEDAAAEGDVAGSQMEVDDDEPPAAEAPSSMAVTDAKALPLPPAVAELPASLQMDPSPPSLSIAHSVDDLRGLSTALSTFVRCWDSLSHHLGSIQGSMETLFRVLDAHHPLPLRAPPTQGKQRQEKMEEEGPGVREAEEEEVKDDKETAAAAQADKPEQPQKASPLDLESICEKMLGRNLRRYVVAHMSEVDRLREEVPRALRLAPDPPKLVLSCIGRFYLQGSRAYADPNSPMVSVRRACILVLEFFLLSGCPFSSSGHLPFSSSNATEVAEGKEEPSTCVMEEANVAAIAWKNRLVAEGGVAEASAVDALGLALFVASFGIPSDFDSEMLYDVFRLCNMKKKADILRQSPIIVEKLPGVIDDLVQKEKYIAAADLACGFGLEEKYPPLDLISTFLIKTNTVAKEERRDGQCSMRSLKEATANQLAAYKSVVKCLEDHKLDPSSLASFKVGEKISKLEKEIKNFEKKLKDKNLKRKAEDAKLTAEVKGPAKHTASTRAEATSGSRPSWVKPTQDHGRALLLSKNLYNGSSNRFSGLLDGSGVGNLTGNVLGPAGAGGRLAAAASLFAGSGYSVGSNIRPSAESGGISYRWYQDGALGDSSIGRSYVGMGHSGQGLIGPPPTENLLQLPASPLGMGGRATGSGLYEFADNVMENELHYVRSVRSNALSHSASGYR